jgi:hypothetical protein
VNAEDLIPTRPQGTYQPGEPLPIGAPVQPGDVIGRSGGAGAIVGPVKQASAAPIRKVAVGAVASAIAVLVIWALTVFAKIAIPPEVAGAIAVIVYAIVAYIVPPAEQDQVQPAVSGSPGA